MLLIVLQQQLLLPWGVQRGRRLHASLLSLAQQQNTFVFVVRLLLLLRASGADVGTYHHTPRKGEVLVVGRQDKP
jgi:hypothetical protein